MALDLPLGDFWGADWLHDDWPIREGSTVLLANSAKGAEVLGELQEDIDSVKVPFDEVYQNQGVVFVRPLKEIPRQRARALKHLRGGRSLAEWLGCFPFLRYYGFICLNTRSMVYRGLRASLRMLKGVLGRHR